MITSRPEYDPEEEAFSATLGTTGNHPAPELLRAYGEGVLPPEAQLAVRDHLSACGLCVLLAADLASLPEPELTPVQLERIHAAATDARKAKPSPSRYVAIAAMVLLSLAAGIGIYWHHQATATIAHTLPAAPQAQPAPGCRVGYPAGAPGTSRPGEHRPVASRCTCRQGPVSC